MWWLAQDLPDAKLLEGGAQEILVWVVLAQVALWIATTAYFILCQRRFEAKYDKLQEDLLKITHRSNRAMEAVANLPPPGDH